MENFIAARERSKIDQQSLTHMIFGSKEKYERFLYYVELLKTDPEALITPNKVNEYSKLDKIKFNISANVKFRKLFPKLRTLEDYPHHFFFQPGFLIGAIGVAMVITAVDKMGTDEQIGIWYEKLCTGEYSAAYAQTE